MITRTPYDDGDDVFSAMRRAYLLADKPLTAQLDITYRCDLDCYHCYLDDKKWDELDTAQWIDVLDQLAEAGVLLLTMSGGEIYLRKDFPEIVRHAGRRGLYTRVKTHGGHITEERAEDLKASGVSGVDFSLYSLRAEIHDGVTRRRGSLERTLRALEVAKAAGLRTHVNCPVVREAFDDIEDVFRYCTERGHTLNFSFGFQRDHSASPALDHLAHDRELIREGRVRLTRLGYYDVKPVPETTPEPDALPCTAGKTLVYITPDGAVWPCVNWPMPLGNLRHQRFLDIWNTSPLRLQARDFLFQDRHTCQGCSGSSVCGYCPGDAFKKSGDWAEGAPSMCDLAAGKMLAMADTSGVALTADQLARMPKQGTLAPITPPFVAPIHVPLHRLALRKTGT